MKHTQGPWIFEEANQIIWVGTPKNNYTKIDEIVLHINQDENYKEEVKEKNRANAKLIAAAPEMLAILERLEHWQDKNTDDTLDKICHDAHLLYKRLNS